MNTPKINHLALNKTSAAPEPLAKGCKEKLQIMFTVQWEYYSIQYCKNNVYEDELLIIKPIGEFKLTVVLLMPICRT